MTTADKAAFERLRSEHAFVRVCFEQERKKKEPDYIALGILFELACDLFEQMKALTD